jgi:peptidoglycan/LPS O-acetylase OafA/YrhL
LKHLKSIDAIRAIAVLLVVYWHYIPRHPLKEVTGIIEFLFIPSGNFAVTLFFVLSGFLITGILLRDKDYSANRMLVVKNFMIRRVLRIFPIYYLLLIVLILLKYPFFENELLYQLTFTSNHFVYNVNDWTEFGHTWSLSVEEQFYLIWPWIILFVANKYHHYLFYAFMVISVISVWYFLCPDIFNCDDPRFTHTSSNLAAFAIGGLYASMSRTDNGNAAISRYMKYVFAGALLAYFYTRISIIMSVTPHFVYTSRLIDALVSMGIIHYMMAVKTGPVKDYIIDNRFINMTGRMSYGMYLYHIPIRYYYEGYLKQYGDALAFKGTHYITFLPFFAIVFIVSYVSYEFFEKKILRLKQKFSVGAF